MLAKTLATVVVFGRFERDVDCGLKEALVPSGPLWRTKKWHFRPSDEMSMKNVDKDAVNTK
jgi:hypothetical protein